MLYFLYVFYQRTHLWFLFWVTSFVDGLPSNCLCNSFYHAMYWRRSLRIQSPKTTYLIFLLFVRGLVIYIYIYIYLFKSIDFIGEPLNEWKIFSDPSIFNWSIRHGYCVFIRFNRCNILMSLDWLYDLFFSMFSITKMHFKTGWLSFILNPNHTYVLRVIILFFSILDFIWIHFSNYFSEFYISIQILIQ